MMDATCLRSLPPEIHSTCLSLWRLPDFDPDTINKSSVLSFKFCRHQALTRSDKQNTLACDHDTLASLHSTVQKHEGLAVVVQHI